jgi:hypothetical protein
LTIQQQFQETIRPQRDSFATTPSIPDSSKSTASQVCVKEWYLGTEHRDSDTGYYLSWEKNVMTFKQGRSSPAIQFDVPYEIESIKVRSSPFCTARCKQARLHRSTSNPPLDLISSTRSSLCKRVVLKTAFVHEIAITLRWACLF